MSSAPSSLLAPAPPQKHVANLLKCMVSLAALIVWRLPPYVVFLPWLTIACLDGLYMSSALTKVPDGAWFTLLLAGVLACFLILWRFGKEQQWAAEAEDRFPTTHLVEKDAEGWLKLTPTYGGDHLSVVKGFGKLLLCKNKNKIVLPLLLLRILTVETLY